MNRFEYLNDLYANGEPFMELYLKDDYYFNPTNLNYELPYLIKVYRYIKKYTNNLTGNALVRYIRTEEYFNAHYTIPSVATHYFKYFEIVAKLLDETFNDNWIIVNNILLHFHTTLDDKLRWIYERSHDYLWRADINALAKVMRTPRFVYETTTHSGDIDGVIYEGGTGRTRLHITGSSLFNFKALLNPRRECEKYNIPYMDDMEDYYINDYYNNVERRMTMIEYENEDRDAETTDRIVKMEREIEIIYMETRGASKMKDLLFYLLEDNGVRWEEKMGENYYETRLFSPIGDDDNYYL